MKLTVILGWAKTDANGHPLGAPKLISGPPADPSETQEQARLFTAAKQAHQFPKGIRHLAFGEITIADRAVFISDEVADQIETRQQQRLAALEAEEKRRQEAKEKANAVTASKARISAAAVAHNNASATLTTAKNFALDAEANWKTGNKTEALKAIMDAAKAKVEELEKAEAKAKRELQAAKKGEAPEAPANDSAEAK